MSLNWLLEISILFFLLSLHSHCASGPVLSLEEEELDSYIKKKPYVFVDMYLPTCPHCKALAPEFQKAAQIAKDTNKPYNFVKINGKTNPGLGQKYEVSGYPTLKLFVNGQILSYEGNRTADAMLQFIDKKVGPQYITIKNVDELMNVANNESLGLRVFFRFKKQIEGSIGK